MPFSSSSNPQTPATEDDAPAQQQNKKKNDLVIFVDKDSGDKLDELFSSALQRKTPLQVPFAMRNLPPSFFNPPSLGSKSPSSAHSRENSEDSAFGSGTTIGSSAAAATGKNQNVNQSPMAPSAIPSGLVVHHSRAHSSPASLGKLNIHLNLGSLNLGTVTSSSPSPDHSPSAATSKTTKRTTASSNESSTTSVNAAKASSTASTTTTNQQAQPQQAQSQSANSHNNLPHNILDRTLQNIHSRGRSYDIPSLQQQIQFGELPPGWEQAKTQDGRVYYIKWVIFFFFSSRRRHFAIFILALLHVIDNVYICSLIVAKHKSFCGQNAAPHTKHHMTQWVNVFLTNWHPSSCDFIVSHETGQLLSQPDHDDVVF